MRYKIRDACFDVRISVRCYPCRLPYLLALRTLCLSVSISRLGNCQESLPGGSPASVGSLQKRPSEAGGVPTVFSRNRAVSTASCCSSVICGNSGSNSELALAASECSRSVRELGVGATAESGELRACKARGLRGKSQGSPLSALHSPPASPPHSPCSHPVSRIPYPASRIPYPATRPLILPPWTLNPSP